MRILLVEDHKRLADTIVDGLSAFGFGVDAFGAAEDGLAAKKNVDYDAIVLDLGLPDRDGMDVLSELRRADSVTPVIILTARDAIDDRVTGLDRGASQAVRDEGACCTVARATSQTWTAPRQCPQYRQRQLRYVGTAGEGER
jgi:DNA-binding response OmpR family regulator